MPHLGFTWISNLLKSKNFQNLFMMAKYDKKKSVTI